MPRIVIHEVNIHIGEPAKAAKRAPKASGRRKRRREPAGRTNGLPDFVVDLGGMVDLGGSVPIPRGTFANDFIDGDAANAPPAHGEDCGKDYDYEIHDDELPPIQDPEATSLEPGRDHDLEPGRDHDLVDEESEPLDGDVADMGAVPEDDFVLVEHGLLGEVSEGWWRAFAGCAELVATGAKPAGDAAVAALKHLKDPESAEPTIASLVIYGCSMAPSGRARMLDQVLMDAAGELHSKIIADHASKLRQHEEAAEAFLEAFKAAYEREPAMARTTVAFRWLDAKRRMGEIHGISPLSPPTDEQRDLLARRLPPACRRAADYGAASTPGA